MAASKSSWRSRSPNKDAEEEASASAEVREKTVGRFRLVPHSSKCSQIFNMSSYIQFASKVFKDSNVKE